MLPSLTTISISFHMTPLYSSTGTDKWTRKINKFKKKEKKKKNTFPTMHSMNTEMSKISEFHYSRSLFPLPSPLLFAPFCCNESASCIASHLERGLLALHQPNLATCSWLGWFVFLPHQHREACMRVYLQSQGVFQELLALANVGLLVAGGRRGRNWTASISERY